MKTGALWIGIVSVALFSLTGAVLAAPAGAADAYPSRPVELVVPYPAGGSVDRIARLLEPKLTAALGKPVVVDCRPGAAGNIGGAHVAKSAPDGYRILLATDSMISINPHVYKGMGYDPFKDLTPIIGVASTPIAIAVSPSLKVNTLPELIAHAKQHPKKVFFGTTGSGSVQHILGESINDLAGVDMVHVAYKGIANIVTDLLGGHIPVAIGTVGVFLPHAEAGKMKIVALADTKRFEGAPNVPLVSETYKGYHGSNAWYGFYAPAGTPKEVVAKLNAAIGNAIKAEDVRSQLVSMAMTPLGGTPEQLTELGRGDSERRGKIVREKGIKPE